MQSIYPHFIPLNLINKQLETNSERLLQLSDEYHITSVKILIEKSLISQLTQQSWLKKPLYGKAIDDRINYVTSLLNLSDMYILKRLRAECLECLSNNFTKTQLESNGLFMELDSNNRVEIYGRKLDLLEEKLKQKDERLKKMQDECLKQKFELKNLKNYERHNSEN